MKAYGYMSECHSDLPLADDTAVVSGLGQGLERSDKEVRDLLAAEPAVSLHDHPFRYPVPLTTETWGLARLERRLVLGYEGLTTSGLGATVACTHSWCTRDETITILAKLRCDIDHRDGFYVAESVGRIRREFRSGRGQVGVLLGLESLTAFADDLGAVELLYSLGVRVAGLIYSDGSILGSGLSQASDGGLTSLGHSYIRRMNEVGIAVDLAHVGDRTTRDAIEASSKPVMISHAGARGLWRTSRMKPDDVLRALVDRNGVIGVEAAPNTTLSPKQETHNLDSVMEHVEYLIHLVGIDHVAFGPDLIFGDHSQLHSIRGIGTTLPSGEARVKHAAYVDGMENPGEAFWSVTSWLVQHGYGREDILKLTSRNGLRVLSGAIDF